MRLLIQVTGFALLMLLAGISVQATDNELDRLFSQLKQAPDEITARTIEEKIWSQWFNSGNAEINALMEIAMAQRNVYDFAGALETLDRLTKADPDYAEAWNQRATIYFFREEYDQSLEAIARTLELEPRHFGAMAGRVVIRLRQLKPALARQNLLIALEINPWLRERALFPDLGPPGPEAN